jgi:hypothetical protein
MRKRKGGAMGLLGYFLFACVLLSLLQAAFSALVVALVIVLVFGVFFCPAETFGLLAMGLFSQLSRTHPLACVWLFALFLVTGLVLSRTGNADAVSGPVDEPTK